MDKQTATTDSRQIVAKPTRWLVGTMRLQGSNRLRRFFGEGNQALLIGFSRRDSQTWGAVGVAIQAIDLQAANLIASGSAPASDEERRSLVGTVERADGFHQTREFLFRNIARNPLCSFRQISRS